MRSRTGLLTALACVVLAVALAFGLTRAAAPPAPAPRAAAPAPTPAPPPAAAEPDPRQLRDVFRFADEMPPAPPAAERRGGRPYPSPVATVTPPPGPRLVGLLRRPGGLVAVLSLEGEVELAAAGQAAAGVTVLAVDEDGARVRRADGSEETLTLPEPE
ncbi:MAG TPA: hypothetical protein VMX54_09290 [Vicinamibacteria bacterium]|nr:hypothetical protein [Vicinamibacteria bacterium]